ncbi:MAG: hypothetical protein GXP45_07705 [bacterium]|nr:hypothetical protein [bacterium]
MIPGFDKGVVGMKKGQTQTLTLVPKDAYGERDPKAMISVDRSKLPDADKYKVGTEVMTQMGQKLKVHEITDDTIVFDANHELAGKTLLFDVTVLGIK